MACNRWENEGLLLTSGELSQEEQTSYESHLSECSECKDEHTAYTEMKERFFTPELLEEQTSISIDAAFEKKEAPVVFWNMPIFTMIQQRVAPALLVVLGIYIGYALMTPKESTVATKEVPVNTASVTDSLEVEQLDTLREFHEGGTEGIKSVDVTE